MKNIFGLSAVALASSALVGCVHMEPITKEHDRTRKEAAANIENISKPFAPPGLVMVSRPLLGISEVEVAPKALPAAFEQDVSFASFGVQSLPEIVDTLSRMSGLQFDVREVLGSGNAPGQSAPPGLPPGQDLNSQRLAYRYSGKLKLLLDDLAARLNASWRYDHDLRQVIFYRYESRIFNVMLPAGKKSVNASISIGGGSGSAGGGSGGGASGGGSGGSVSISSDAKIDPWGSMMDGVKVFLGQTSSSTPPVGASGSGGGSAEIVSGADGYAVGNRDLAQLIVVARPNAVRRIGQFVEETNRRFARNVLIDVRVVEIQSNRGGSAGFSASALLQTALAAKGWTQFDIGFTGATIPTVGQPSQVTISATRQGVTSQIGVDAIVQALSSVSNVAVRNQGQIVAINGQPAPFQQANQVSYLANIQTTQTPNVGSQTSVQPGTVTVGFTANFIPTIMADNRIMLQYQLQSSSLLGLRTVGPANALIQVPEIYTQSLQQQAYVRDGDVLVLFGFEQERSQISDSAGFTSMGRAAQQNQVMTAVILQVRTSKEST